MNRAQINTIHTLINGPLHEKDEVSARDFDAETAVLRARLYPSKARFRYQYKIDLDGNIISIEKRGR